MKRTCCLWIVVAIVAMAPALVQAAEGFRTGTAAGNYAGIFGGYSWPKDLEVDNLGDRELDHGWTAGARIGTALSDWGFALELEYFYQQNDFDTIPGELESHNAMVNLLWKYPTPYFRPYLGAGAGWSWAEVKDTNLFTDNDSNDFAWQLMAGVEIPLGSPRVTADLRYKYFQTEYGFSPGDSKFKNHVGMAGINYYFQ